MNTESWVALLVLAIALAVQPWSLLAAVLLVASEHGVRKEIAYVIGWVLALTAVAVATIVLYPATPQTTATSVVLSIIELAAGAVLAIWAVVRWGHSEKLASSQEPKWMARLDGMSPIFALALGIFLPNYVLVVAAVTNVLELGLSKGGATLAIFAWVVVASLGVAAPLLVLVFRRDSAPEVFESWRAWLIAHGQRVVIGVVGLVGLVLVAKGIIGIVG